MKEYSFACKCGERKKPIRERNWVVTRRECNNSYFEYPKGAEHPSNYSTVYCKKCGSSWRTKAKYVYFLEDGNWLDI